MGFSAVILAAGKGTRMCSRVPKALHMLAGKPMVKHVIDTCISLEISEIHLVYGYHSRRPMRDVLRDEPVNWVLQKEQLGTGHAVSQVSHLLHSDERVIILYGDVPLISKATIQNLLKSHCPGGVALLTMFINNPAGYGRVLRKDENVVAIVEQEDATSSQLLIKEVNTGVLVALGSDLRRWIGELKKNSTRGEYYLTDIIGAAHKEGGTISTISPSRNIEAEGVNDRVQLANLERAYQKSMAASLLSRGVTLRDENRFDLRGQLKCGFDVEIDINVVIEGSVSLGNDVKVGVGCILTDCKIDDGTFIGPYSVVEGTAIGKRCNIGPFARIRPGTKLDNSTRVGNFVEIKNTRLGKGSKVNHLSYVGDADIGENVNLGAGTITCNYDGANKHKTIIGNDVFVGSDTQLIAPVYVASGSTIGAGSTITRDITGKDQLVLTRAQERRISGWKRPVK